MKYNPNNIKKTFLSITILFLFSFTIIKDSKTVKAGMKMQEFVINLSKYARSFDPDFIVIPQNGAELAFNKINPEGTKNIEYLNAIDGFGVEELFYTENGKIDNYRMKMFQKLKEEKKILVSEYILKDSVINDVISKNSKENFLCFPRTINNQDYKEIPSTITDENTNDIHKIKDAKNYLYIINSKNFKNKYYFLKAISETNYDAVILDLFFFKSTFNKDEIEKIKTKANGGKRLILAYMNIGAAENWRYYWNGNWILNDPIWLKKKYAGYDDEIYVQFWNPDWQKIIFGNDTSYLKKIIDAGFDGAYLDNVEAYYFLYNN